MRHLKLADLGRTPKEILPAFAAGTLALQALNTLMLAVTLVSVASVASKAPPTLVQLVDGRPIRVAPTDHLEREAETVRRFVADTLALMMDWSGYLPPQSPEEAKKPQPDPGMNIQGGGRLTTAAWQAGFSLAPELRREFLKRLAEITPREVFGGGTQIVLVTQYIGNPVQIAPGKWKLVVLASLVTFKRSEALGDAVPFNKEVFVRASEPPALPEGAQNASTLQKTIYRIRQAGLEIYAIRDFRRPEL